MIYKYSSCKRVIARVLSNLELQEGQKRVADMVEWIGQALEKIGAFPQFVIKTTGRDGEPALEITDYQCRLPMGLHNIIQVGYSELENGPVYAMRYGTGSFDYNKIGSDQINSNPTLPSQNQIVTTAMSLYKMTYEEALLKINTEPETRDLISAMITTTKNSLEYQFLYIL